MDEKGKKIFGLNRNIFFLGLVSLFNDFSNEMIQAVMPVFLATLLGGQAVLAIGVIEGIADALASLVKVVSGTLSDKFGHRKYFAVAGYVISVSTRPFWGLATKFGHAFTLRLTDRFGKGFRDPPRDALLASSVQTNELGKSFGYHRAMDSLGRLLGPLAVVIIFPIIGYNYQNLFWLSFFVGLLAVFSFFFVKDIKLTQRPADKLLAKENLFKNHKHFTLFVATIFVFGLGTLPVTLMLYRAVELGFDGRIVPLLYFVYGLVSTIASLPLGKLSDKIGMVKVIAAGFVMATAAYITFATSSSLFGLVVAFVLIGLYTAATDGVERALAAKLIGHELLGAGEGVLQSAVGISSLFAGSIGGVLWFSFGHVFAFSYVAAISLLGLTMLLVVNHKHRI